LVAIWTSLVERGPTNHIKKSDGRTYFNRELLRKWWEASWCWRAGGGRVMKLYSTYFEINCTFFDTLTCPPRWHIHQHISRAKAHQYTVDVLFLLGLSPAVISRLSLCLSFSCLPVSLATPHYTIVGVCKFYVQGRREDQRTQGDATYLNPTQYYWH